jgi:hypothetical protein
MTAGDPNGVPIAQNVKASRGATGPEGPRGFRRRCPRAIAGCDGAGCGARNRLWGVARGCDVGAGWGARSAPCVPTRAWPVSVGALRGHLPERAVE